MSCLKVIVIYLGVFFLFFFPFLKVAVFTCVFEKFLEISFG